MPRTRRHRRRCDPVDHDSPHPGPPRPGRPRGGRGGGRCSPARTRLRRGGRWRRRREDRRSTARSMSTADTGPGWVSAVTLRSGRDRSTTPTMRSRSVSIASRDDSTAPASGNAAAPAARAAMSSQHVTTSNGAERAIASCAAHRTASDDDSDPSKPTVIGSVMPPSCGEQPRPGRDFGPSPGDPAAGPPGLGLGRSASERALVQRRSFPMTPACVSPSLCTRAKGRFAYPAAPSSPGVTAPEPLIACVTAGRPR